MYSYPPAPPIGDDRPVLQHPVWLPAVMRRAWQALALVFVLAVVGFVAARLWWGVDFTDEAFYAVLPYRFAVGDVPLRDEQNLAQFAGLLALPAMELFLSVASGTDGMIVAMRHAHLVFTMGVASVVFLAARRWVGGTSAAVTACACIAFVPFTLHGLSYNTFASGFLTAALFLAARARSRHAAASSWFWTGLLLALAAVVYPTLAVGALAFMAFAFWPSEDGVRPRELIAFVAGGLAVVGAVLALVLAVGIDSALAIPKYLASFTTQGGGWPKVARAMQDFLQRTPFLGATLLAGATVLATARRAPAHLAPTLLIVPALFWRHYELANGTYTLYLVSGVALLGPWLAPLARQTDAAKLLLRLVWWPSILCGAVTAWSSSNGAMNASIGAFPAAVCTLLLLQMVWRQHADGTVIRDAVAQLGALAASALLAIALVAGDYKDYYGEPVRREALTSHVTWGPYKGLATTPSRAHQLEEFRRTVLPQLRPDDRSFVFDGFPGGYLLLGLRPAVNSVWLPPAGREQDRSLTVAYWERRKAPTVVFVAAKTMQSKDPLLGILAGWGFEPVVTTELGTLLRRKP